MKAKALFTFFILMANLFVMAQNQDWEIHIGLSNRAEGAKDLIEYYDKGYYLEGLVEVSQEWNGWNVKTNINGEIIWDKIIEYNPDIMYGWCVVLDDEGNRYVAGDRFSDDDVWPFVTKFNPCGEPVWCKIIINDQLDEGSVWDIIINENNEIIILSNYISLANEMQIYLECFDQNGEYLWKKPYARQEDHPWIDVPVAFDLMEHNHEYYISGYCYWPFPSDTTHYFLRPLFIGVDSLFNEKWILPFYALDSVFGDAYYSLPLNDSIIMGVGLRRVGNDGNSLLMYYNTDGENIGFSQITNDQIGMGIISNYMRIAAKINDSLFIAAGFYEPVYSTFYNMDFKTDTSANLYNFQLRPNVTGMPSLIKSSDNNYVVASTIKEPNNDKNLYLYKIDENLEFVPFDTNTYTYDSLCPEPIQSGTIDLSSCLVWTGTEEIPLPEEYYSFIATIPITAYPNPAETEITLAFQNTDHHSNMQLECFNIYGQKVHSEKIWKGQQQTKLNISNWSNGLYFTVVKSEGKVAGTCKFVVKGK
jgi:hypothetical protein